MPRGHGFGPPWWHGRFKGYGYRITIPRQAILDVLSKTQKHLSAEEIYLEVRRLYPAVGLTTIYRTLEILVNMGLVFKFDFGDGRARYELTKGLGGRHYHLICKNCNRVIDYTEFTDEQKELMDQMEKALSKKYNFKITDHLLQFYGLCEKCSGKIKGGV